MSMSDRKTKLMITLVILSILVFALKCRESWAAEYPLGGLNQWTIRNGENPNYTLYDVAYGSNIFVAVGAENDQGTQRDLILYSPTGEKWTPVTEHFNGILNAVTYVEDYKIFYAVGEEELVLTSTDGMNWTKHANDIKSSLVDVAYGNDVVCASSDSSVFYSQGKADWQNENRKSLQDSSSVHALAYGSKKFVAIDDGNVYTSTDGMSDWVKVGEYCNLSLNKCIHSIIYNGTKWVAVGELDYEGTIFTSTSADSTWARLGFDTKAFRDVAWGGNYFVAVTEDEQILSSTDGEGWISRYKADSSSPSKTLCGVAYGNNTFVAVGHSGLILQSNVIDPYIHTLSMASYSPVIFSQSGTIEEGNVQYTSAAEVIAALPQSIPVTLEDGSTIAVPGLAQFRHPTPHTSLFTQMIN